MRIRIFASDAIRPESVRAYEVHDGFILLWGLGFWRTITNDIDRILKWLHCTGHLTPGTRVLYEDSDGNWDEILYRGDGGFCSFRYLHHGAQITGHRALAIARGAAAS